MAMFGWPTGSQVETGPSELLNVRPAVLPVGYTDYTLGVLHG